MIIIAEPLLKLIYGNKEKEEKIEEPKEEAPPNEGFPLNLLSPDLKKLLGIEDI